MCIFAAAAAAGLMSASTAATASLVTTAVGGLVSAYGAYQGGKAQQAMYDYQAQIDRNNAQDALLRGEQEETAHRQKVAQIKASQRVGFAASGIDLGSENVSDTLADTAMLGELDAQTIRNNAQRESINYLNSATGNTAAGKNAKSAGTMTAMSTILGTASTVDSKWSDYKRAGVWN